MMIAEIYTQTNFNISLSFTFIWKGKDIYSNTDLVYVRRPQDENNHTISFFPIAHEWKNPQKHRIFKFFDLSVNYEKRK